MYQLFANLIVNAVKHNDADEPVVQVIGLGPAQGGGRRWMVRDNGSGVAPEDMDSVFEPFFKGKGGETGVGLATVQKIVEPVSYTHLTLPTKRIVQISVVAVSLKK